MENTKISAKVAYCNDQLQSLLKKLSLIDNITRQECLELKCPPSLNLFEKLQAGTSIAISPFSSSNDIAQVQACAQGKTMQALKHLVLQKQLYLGCGLVSNYDITVLPNANQHSAAIILVPISLAVDCSSFTANSDQACLNPALLSGLNIFGQAADFDLFPEYPVTKNLTEYFANIKSILSSHGYIVTEQCTIFSSDPELYTKALQHLKHCSILPDELFKEALELLKDQGDKLLEFAKAQSGDASSTSANDKQDSLIAKILTLNSYQHELSKLEQNLAKKFNASIKELDAKRLYNSLAALSVLHASPEVGYMQIERDLSQIEHTLTDFELLEETLKQCNNHFNLDIKPNQVGLTLLEVATAKAAEAHTPTKAGQSGSASANKLNAIRQMLLAPEQAQQCLRDVWNLLRQEHVARKYLQQFFIDSLFKLSNEEIRKHAQSIARTTILLNAKIPLPSKNPYECLNYLASYDRQILKRAHAALNHPAIIECQSQLSLPALTNLNKLHSLNLCLQALKDIMEGKHKISLETLKMWGTKEAREQFHKLYSEMDQHENVLTQARSEFKNVLANVGMSIDIDRFSADTLQKLEQARKNFPEKERLIEHYQNPEAFSLINIINSRVEEWQRLTKDVNNIRARLHLDEQTNNERLFNELNVARDNLKGCEVNENWIDNKDQILSLLDNLEKQGEEVRNERNNIIRQFSTDIFDLDCKAMLWRFQKQYNVVVKAISADYKRDVHTLKINCKFNKDKLTDEDFVNILKRLVGYRDLHNRYRSFINKCARYFPSLNSLGEEDYSYDWSHLKDYVNHFSDFSMLFMSEKAAYLFLHNNEWDAALKPLKQMHVVHNWYKNNPQASTIFGTLYKEGDSDTKLMANLLNVVKSTAGLFQSKELYNEFVHSSGDQNFALVVQKFKQLHAAQEYFTQNQANIQNSIGMPYHHGMQVAWDELLKKLELYNKLAASVGDKQAYALTHSYVHEHKLLQTYHAAIKEIYEIKEPLRKLYQRPDFMETALAELIEKSYNLLHVAFRIKGEYDFAFPYLRSAQNIIQSKQSEANVQAAKVQLLSRLSLPLLKKMYDALGVISRADPRSESIEQQARDLFGSDYQGAQSNWNLLKAKLDEHNQLLAQFGGKLPNELLEAANDSSPANPLFQLYNLAHSPSAQIKLHALLGHMIANQDFMTANERERGVKESELLSLKPNESLEHKQEELHKLRSELVYIRSGIEELNGLQVDKVQELSFNQAKEAIYNLYHMQEAHKVTERLSEELQNEHSELQDDSIILASYSAALGKLQDFLTLVEDNN